MVGISNIKYFIDFNNLHPLYIAITYETSNITWNSLPLCNKHVLKILIKLGFLPCEHHPSCHNFRFIMKKSLYQMFLHKNSFSCIDHYI